MQGANETEASAYEYSLHMFQLIIAFSSVNKIGHSNFSKQIEINFKLGLFMLLANVFGEL